MRKPKIVFYIWLLLLLLWLLYRKINILTLKIRAQLSYHYINSLTGPIFGDAVVYKLINGIKFVEITYKTIIGENPTSDNKKKSTGEIFFKNC